MNPEPERVPPRPDGLHAAPVAPPPPVAVGAGTATATWKPWEAIAIYVAALLVGGLVTLPILDAFDDEDLGTLVSAAVAATVITGLLVLWLSRAHPTWRSVMAMPPRERWWPEIRAAIGFGLLLYPGMVFGVGLLVNLILSAITGETVQAPEQVPGGLSAFGIAITIVYAVVIAPLHEEFFFRGILFRGVRDRYGLGAGLVASGIGFGLIHYLEGPWQDAVLLITVMVFNGIALAWYHERRRTLLAPIVAHMTFNVIGLTLIWTVG